MQEIETKIRQKLQNKGFDFEKQTIGVMGNSKMLKMVRKFYSQKYQIVALYNYMPGADVQLFDLTPYEWAFVFKYFKLTFTTYFHGTMLSLRNGVPLICCALDTSFAKKHTPKTLDVLARLGFSDWYFKTDYEKINLQEIKEKADSLLSSNLHDTITKAIDTEAQSYTHFHDALKKAIEN